MGKHEEMVRIALGQKNAPNGREYVRWYNQVSGRSIALDSAWCAIFVSWCARQAGVTEEELATQAGCTTLRNWLKKRKLWRERGWTPRRGDLILFDWDGDPTRSEHVGMVTGVKNGIVSTVEGNSGTPGRVREKRYQAGSRYILGYGAWEEKEEADLTREETEKLIGQAIQKANGEFLGMLANAQKESEEKLAAAMEARLEKLGAGKVYRTAEEVPQWGQGTVRALMVTGRLRGNEKGELNLSHDLLRALVIMERGEQVCR